MVVLVRTQKKLWRRFHQERMPTRIKKWCRFCPWFRCPLESFSTLPFSPSNNRRSSLPLLAHACVRAPARGSLVLLLLLHVHGLLLLVVPKITEEIAQRLPSLRPGLREKSLWDCTVFGVWKSQRHFPWEIPQRKRSLRDFEKSLRPTSQRETAQRLLSERQA